MEIITKSAQSAKNFGKQLTDSLKGGEILALVGDLGSGKTTFVQGLAEGFGISSNVISPTFILMREYECKSKKQNSKCKNLYHVDLYRLEDDVKAELKNLGIMDLWEKKENIVVIEWADKAREFMPKNTRWIEFKSLEDDQKRITI